MPTQSFELSSIKLFLDLPFSFKELPWSLHDLRLNSSPELDNIDYVIIKKLIPLVS